jgi:hypothetical protein
MNVNKKSMEQKEGDTPKPYSAYTIFWRLERKYILQEAGCIGKGIKECYDPNHHDPLEHPRPEKYADLILPPFWYSSAHRKECERKRKHRKQEGSIGKNDLTAMIAKSWREVDTDVRNYVSKLATAEKRKYEAIRKSAVQTEPKSPPALPELTSISPPPVVWPRSLGSEGRHLEARQISMGSGEFFCEPPAVNFTAVFDIPSTVGKVEEVNSATLSDGDLSLFDCSSLEHDDFLFNFWNESL